MTKGRIILAIIFLLILSSCRFLSIKADTSPIKLQPWTLNPKDINRFYEIHPLKITINSIRIADKDNSSLEMPNTKNIDGERIYPDKKWIVLNITIRNISSRKQDISAYKDYFIYSITDEKARVFTDSDAPPPSTKEALLNDERENLLGDEEGGTPDLPDFESENVYEWLPKSSEISGNIWIGVYEKSKKLTLVNKKSELEWDLII